MCVGKRRGPFWQKYGEKQVDLKARKIEGAVWPGTGYRGVKLPGFRLLQSMAVSELCAAGTNGLRDLSLVR